MKTKTFTPMGALHPILFFAGVYAVVLMFSIFICSALFYSCNAAPVNLADQKNLPVEKPAPVVDHSLSAVVMR